MKVAAVVVGTDDERFRRVDANRERMQLAERIAGFTKSTADVVLLPAGFLAAKADRAVDWASYNEPALASDGLWAEVKLWKV